MYGRERRKKCVIDPLGKRKRESISDCESSDSNLRIACKMTSMPMEHVVKLLDIVARERKLANLNQSMQSIRRELCSEVNVLYDYATVDSEYKRQYSLHRTFLLLQACGFTFNQETKFLEATETQWNQQVLIDSTVAQLRNVELTIVDKWEEVFDKMPVLENKPKLLKENVGSRRTSRSLNHPYTAEVESITIPFVRCITRLRSFNNLPSLSYVAGAYAMTKFEDFPRWLCDEPDEILLLWLVSKTPDEKRGEMEAFYEDWKMVPSTQFSQ